MPEEEKQWYYSVDGQRNGPICSDELKNLADAGKIGLTDLVWKEGMAEWKPAGKVKGLFPQPKLSTPPALPTSPPFDHTQSVAPPAYGNRGPDIVLAIVLTAVLLVAMVISHLVSGNIWIGFLIVLASAGWASYDASAHRITAGFTRGEEAYTANNGSIGWFVGCILLWIFVFPLYLIKRSQVLRKRGILSTTDSITSPLKVVPKDAKAVLATVTAGSKSPTIVVAIISVAALVLSFGWFLIGSGRSSPDSLATEVRPLILKEWQKKALLHDATIENITLVHKGGNEYRGFVDAKIRGESVQLSLEVTYDGKNILWQTKILN